MILDTEHTDSNLEYIGSSAFEGCTALTSISIPENVVYIGEYAFKNCGGITTVEFTGMAVETVGFGAFKGCYSITTMTVPFVGGGYVEPMLDENGKLIEAPTTHFGYIFGAESAADNAESISPVLKTVIVLGGETVDGYAFAGCANLENIKLPDSILTVGKYAFDGCSGIERFTVPGGVISIGFGAFSGCDSLLSIVIPFVGGGYIAPELDENGDPVEPELDDNGDPIVVPTTHFGYIFGAYDENENSYFVPATLRIVVISNVCEISEYAFGYCEYLADVKYPEGSTVAENAFEGCTGLGKSDNDVDLDNDGFITETDGNTVTLIEYVGNNKVILIPEGITHIGEFAFSGKDITSVTLSSTVISIAAYAFDGCASLETVILNNVVSSIAYGAFEGCYSLNYNEDGNGGFYLGNADNAYYALVKADIFSGEYTTNIATQIICDSAFEGWGVESIRITQAVTVIGKDAFKNCYNLVSISIPDGIAVIGDGAFDGCDKLTYTSLETDDAYYLGNSDNPYLVLVYAKNTGKAAYVVNAGAKMIVNGAFAGLKSMAKITLPQSLVVICDGAFDGCIGLVEIYNMSSIEIIPGSEDNGGIGLYAKNIYSVDSEENSNSKITVTDDGFVIYDGTILIGYVGDNTEIVIPDTVTTIHSLAFFNSNIVSVQISQGVTAIEESAFEGCESLEKIVIAQSVTAIGNRAFADCTALTEVIFAEFKLITGEGDDMVAQILTSSLVTIGEYAFTNTAIITITIPDGIDTITAHAFENCANLESVYFGENSAITVIGESAFAGCSALSVMGTAADERSTADEFVGISIPAGVTVISNNAFEFCWSIGTIQFAESVAVIGENAFASCYGLIELVIPSTVTSIGLGAFANCDSLGAITVPYIGDGNENNYFGYIFGAENYEDNGLFVPTYLASVTVTGGQITDNCFYGCNGITNIEITAEVQSIGESAFENCLSLEKFVVPKTVNSIGFAAFRGCEWLSELTISIIDAEGAPVHIGYLFGADTYKKNVKFVPESLTTVNITGNADIVFGAFYGCKYIQNVTFAEESVVSAIGEEAFYGCYGLVAMTIPASVQTIGIRAFWGCDSIAKMTIPFVGGSRTDNTYFGYIFGASSYESNGGYVPELLTEVTITEITEIPAYAFYGCYAITKINFTEDLALTKIGESAFEGCQALEAITLPLYVTEICASAFAGCVGLAEVTVSPISQLSKIGENAFAGCISIYTFDIPKGVSEIGAGAFAGCESLETVNFKSTSGWVTNDGTEMNVTDAAEAASRLKELYADYTWTK